VFVFTEPLLRGVAITLTVQSLPHLTLLTHLKTVLSAGALFPQTAITDVEYLPL